MQTLKLTAHVNEDGILQIQLPDHPGETLEILLVYQPALIPPKRQWSQQFLRTFGAWQGEPLERAPQEEQPEVSNISANGIWLLCGDHEYFLAYEAFPWFENAPVKHIFNLEEPHPGHLYWPDLDVDLSLETIQNPERFPLMANFSSPGE